jgi:hypothetical protein
MQFIDYIYENINIYNSIIIYDANKYFDLDDFINNLNNKDYPIGHIRYNIPIDVLENRYRMIVIPHTQFYNYINIKNNNLSNITVIFCLDKYNYVTNILSKIKFINTIEDINVFKI